MKNLLALTVLLPVCVFGLFFQTANAQGIQIELRNGAQLIPPRRVVPAPMQQPQEAAPQEEQAEDQEDAQVDENTQAEEIIEVPTAKIPQPGSREIRLSLWDGTVVMGNVNIDFLKVETQFGKLEVPVGNIINFRPGLDSFPALTEKITSLVEQLDDRNFQTRERAHRKLVEMGPSIRSVLNGFDTGQSAERKKHLQQIREEIEEILENEDEWGDGGSSDELIRGDTIRTRDFTIVGKILQPEFVLDSKYGQLTIALSDIKTADRTWMQSNDVVTKTVEVKGDAFFQTTPQTTRIRVNKGDRIRIRASGSVQWATWGNVSSTPAGITNQGNWKNFNCGTLLARIGTGDAYESVGTKTEFVAKSSGVLQLGIAMRDNYAQQANYQWPGNYKAKILVTPAPSE